MSSQRTGSDILRLFMEEDIFADSAAGIHGQVMGKYVLWSSHHCWKSLYWPKKSSNGNTTIPLYDTVDGCEILHQLVTIGRYEHCLPSINYIYMIYIYIIRLLNIEHGILAATAALGLLPMIHMAWPKRRHGFIPTYNIWDDRTTGRDMLAMS